MEGLEVRPALLGSVTRDTDCSLLSSVLDCDELNPLSTPCVTAGS